MWPQRHDQKDENQNPFGRALRMIIDDERIFHTCIQSYTYSRVYKYIYYVERGFKKAAANKLVSNPYRFIEAESSFSLRGWQLGNEPDRDHGPLPSPLSTICSTIQACVCNVLVVTTGTIAGGLLAYRRS